MHITQLTLQTSRLDDQRAFYQQIPGLYVTKITSSAFSLQIGETLLTFQAAEQDNSMYHFAFTLPCNRLALAKEWLHAHQIPLLARGAQDEFDFALWNADSLYFHDVSHNIVEFIVHHDLPEERSGPFSAQDLVRVSEIGLVVDNVSAVVGDLQDHLGIKPYKGSSSETFTATGDINGLFIVVQKDRPWWPTDDEQAVIAPIHVYVQGEQAQSYQIAPFSYTINVGAAPQA